MSKKNNKIKSPEINMEPLYYMQNQNRYVFDDNTFQCYNLEQIVAVRLNMWGSFAFTIYYIPKDNMEKLDCIKDDRLGYESDQIHFNRLSKQGFTKVIPVGVGKQISFTEKHIKGETNELMPFYVNDKYKDNAKLMGRFIKVLEENFFA